MCWFGSGSLFATQPYWEPNPNYTKPNYDAENDFFLGIPAFFISAVGITLGVTSILVSGSENKKFAVIASVAIAILSLATLGCIGFVLPSMTTGTAIAWGVFATIAACAIITGIVARNLSIHNKKTHTPEY
jgi:hypothetical protein